MFNPYRKLELLKVFNSLSGIDIPLILNPWNKAHDNTACGQQD